MGRQTFLLVLASVVGLVGPGVAQTFRATTDVVRLPVVVLDRDGGPVSGLAASDFEVFEDGRPQVVTSFAEGALGPDVPLHLGLLLDRSESMEADLRAASDAAVKFVDTLDEARDVTLVEFETTIHVSRFEPPDYPRLFSRIRNGRLGDQTALYDAIGRYVETARGRPGQHVLLVYTDGVDSAHGMTVNDVERLLRLGDVMVYALGYLDNLPSTVRVRQRAILSQLARETGGEAFFPSSVKDVSAIYTRILAEIGTRYTLGYTSSAGARDGRLHTIEVRLTHGRPGVKVRTRSGYIGAPAGAPR
jgi:Ca-activated chloride channel homolog